MEQSPPGANDAAASLSGTARPDGSLSRRLPHYVRDYRRFVEGLLAKGGDRHQAMSQAVGGEFEAVGEALRQVVVEAGLKADDYLIDVGCGSGRLTAALQRCGLPIRYLGADVVPELLAYAEERYGADGWSFVEVDGLYIPEADATADLVVFFSVLTHLSRTECETYLREARRVLKPSGRIVASYIDIRRLSALRQVRFCGSYLAHHLFGRAFKSVAATDRQMIGLARSLQLEIELLGPVIGQSVCVFSLP